MRNFLQKLLHTPGAAFSLYMAAVLTQLSILSFSSVNLRCEAHASQDLHDLFLSTNYWWGAFSMFGAASLLFRKHLCNWKLGSLLGDLASVIMFTFLSYEYLTSKPPVYAAGIMSVTAAIFLIGGLFYERRAV